MGDVSPHFSRHQFGCKCGCGQCIINPHLVEYLEWLWGEFNRAVEITSGNRCAAHNKAVGGSPNSQHVTGDAADFKIKGVAPHTIVATIRLKPGYDQVINELNSWTHLSVPGQKPARGQALVAYKTKSFGIKFRPFKEA